MKKNITIGGFTAIYMALTIITASSAQAQTNVPPAKPEVRAEIRDKKVELKSQIESKKQEIKTMKTERASTSIEAKVAKLTEAVKSSVDHLTKSLGRLNDAKAKIESRLKKFEESGVNTSAARADMALATAALATVQAKIDAVGLIQAGTDTKAFAESLRTAVKSAQSSINDAQKALSKVTSDMRGYEASIKRMKNATSTASSTRN